MKIDKKKNMWLVKASGGDLVEEFLEGEVSIQFSFNDDLSSYNSIEKIKNNLSKFLEIPNRTAFSQLYRIAHEVKSGDYVMTYDPQARVYYLGKIIGDYFFNNKNGNVKHSRKVEWLNKNNPLKRDFLEDITKYSLGSLMTLTKISREEIKKDIIKKLESNKNGIQEISEQKESDIINEDKIDIEENLREDVKSKILELSSEDMEEFIAGVFRGLGYKTRLRGSHTQADGGYDITVSKDGLGLGDDTILVEVKHRMNTKMSASEVRGFDSVLSNKNKKGIYFSSGGFTPDAEKEFKNSELLSFMDLDNLVNIIFDYYDNFDPKTRTLLPLKKVYMVE